MKRIGILLIAALVLSMQTPEDGLCLGLREGGGEASGPADSERPADGSLRDLTMQVERVEAGQKSARIAGVITGVAAMAGGIGLFLAANDELEEGFNANSDDLKIARAGGLVAFGLGIVGFVAAAGP